LVARLKIYEFGSPNRSPRSRPFCATDTVELPRVAADSTQPHRNARRSRQAMLWLSHVVELRRDAHAIDLCPRCPPPQSQRRDSSAICCGRPCLENSEQLRAITTDSSVSYCFGNTSRAFDQPVWDVAHVGDDGLQLFAGQWTELQPGFLEIAEKGRVLRHRHESAT
jgi:hypothetical protein